MHRKDFSQIGGQFREKPIFIKKCSYCDKIYIEKFPNSKNLVGLSIISMEVFFVYHNIAGRGGILRGGRDVPTFCNFGHSAQ